jgi:hypothetical protein
MFTGRQIMMRRAVTGTNSDRLSTHVGRHSLSGCVSLTRSVFASCAVVFFDMTADGAPLGRITMEVGTADPAHQSSCSSCRLCRLT